MHRPKIKVHGLAHKGISLLCVLLGKTLKLQAKHNNARDKWENLPRVDRYQGCTHSFGSSQGLCVEADWEKVCLYLLALKIFTVPVVALMVLHGQTQPTQETVWVQYFYHVSDLIHARCPI